MSKKYIVWHLQVLYLLQLRNVWTIDIIKSFQDIPKEWREELSFGTISVMDGMTHLDGGYNWVQARIYILVILNINQE